MHTCTRGTVTGVLRRAAKSLVDVSQLIRSSSVDALRAATAAEARPSISEEFIGVKAAAAVSAATAAAPIAAAAAATNVVVAPPALMASAGTPPPVRRTRALLRFTSFYSPTPSPAATPNVSRSSSRMDLTTSASLLALDSALDSQPAFLTIEKLEEMASVVFKSAMSVQKNDDDDDASATQKARINAASQEVLALANTVRTVFSSPNSLASSFLTSTTTSDSATLLFDVDVDAVKKAYRLLLVDLAPHTTIRQALLDATELILARLEASAPSWSLSSCGKNARVLAPSIPTSQALRSITVKLRPIVALLCDPLILDGDQSDQLLRRLCSTMASLRRDVKSFT